MRVAILGGSGKLGHGLIARLSAHEVKVGSRDPAKGVPYSEAAAWCEIAIQATPYATHHALLVSIQNELKGKILIDTTVPLDPADPTQIRTATGLSAAEEAAQVVSGAQVFAAFQTISHRTLMQPDASADVLVAGGPTGKEAVLELIRSMKLRPIQAGPLRAAGLIERVTALLISINKTNKVRESSIHVEGIP